MSISNLLSPNNLDLYCDTITTSKDSPVVSRGVHMYSGTTDFFTILLQWVVKDGICTIWCSTSTLTPITNVYAILNLGETVGGYITGLPIPDLNNGVVYYPMTFATQQIHQVNGLCTIDANAGGPGLGRIQFTLNGDYTITGIPPAYVYALVQGSNLFVSQIGILGFSFSYPVANVI